MIKRKAPATRLRGLFLCRSDAEERGQKADRHQNESDKGGNGHADGHDDADDLGDCDVHDADEREHVEHHPREGDHKDQRPEELKQRGDHGGTHRKGGNRHGGTKRHRHDRGSQAALGALGRIRADAQPVNEGKEREHQREQDESEAHPLTPLLFFLCLDGLGLQLFLCLRRFQLLFFLLLCLGGGGHLRARVEVFASIHGNSP